MRATPPRGVRRWRRPTRTSTRPWTSRVWPTECIPKPVREVVADKGYHSNQTMTDFAELEIRSYVSEPDRGRRDWQGKPAERDAVYANRRRIRGQRGKRLMRQRGELIERSFAHVLETGGMRRTHLRGRSNILKRMLVHVGGFNLSLVMRKLIGIGKPRQLQGLFAPIFAWVWSARTMAATLRTTWTNRLTEKWNAMLPTLAA